MNRLTGLRVPTTPPAARPPDRPGRRCAKRDGQGAQSGVGCVPTATVDGTPPHGRVGWAPSPRSSHPNQPEKPRARATSPSTANAISSSVFSTSLKHFRAIATRYDKLAKIFLAAVHLACAAILLNEHRPEETLAILLALTSVYAGFIGVCLRGISRAGCRSPVVSPESQEVMRRADPTPKAVGRATRKGASIQMQQALVVSLLSFDFLRLRQLPTIAPMSHLLFVARRTNGAEAVFVAWTARGMAQMKDRPLFSRLFATAARLLTIAGLAGLLSSICALGIGPAAHAAEAVLTYHYDNGRTGWNSSETTLTRTNVASSRFQTRTVVQLDDQVDAQPLVVPGLATVGGKATQGHDVVYVATENNTVYAIELGNRRDPCPT